MEQLYYENLLQKNNSGSEESEKMWDQRAAHFYEAQKNDRSTFTREVVDVLKRRGMLEKAEILDIGGGSGRYALPLSKEAKHVTLTDISTNMLTLAKEHAEQNGVKNISFEKLVWEKANLADLKWEKKFDVTFASMCPAIRTPEGLYKMADASKGYCVINQYIHNTDSLSRFLREKAELPQGYNPHNDREAVQSIFNLLWLKGYDVELHYLRSKDRYILSREDIEVQYAFVLESIREDRGLDTNRLLSQYAERDGYHITEESVLAMIMWKVSA